MPLNKDKVREQITSVITRYRLYSPAAVELLMGTCAVESDFGSARTQKSGGPAGGILQVEPGTERDIWSRYILPRPALYEAVCKEFDMTFEDISDPLEKVNDDYCILLARFKYRMVPAALPAADNILGLAQYWKRWYNTYLGKGKVSDFILKYNRYCR